MEIYNPIFNRNKTGKYLKEKNFISLVSASGGYLLEDEANELQAIQNELRKDFIKQQLHSGIIYSESNQIYFQNNYGYLENMFSVEPFKVLMNGNVFDVIGCNGNYFDIDKKINNIMLPEPPESNYRWDFVYLEMWLKEVDGDSRTVIWSNGNEDNIDGVLTNDLVDERINGETCRRIQLQWQIRCAGGIDFSENEYGFNNMLENGNMFAKGGNTWDTQYSFWRSDLNLDGNNKFNDKGLWVAGNGDIRNGLNTVDGYSYAIPLFRVFRRNSLEYSTNNIYGGPLYGFGSSSQRPDNKYSNIVYSDDVKDLRIHTSTCVNYSELLNRNFVKLLTSNLSKELVMKKEYFGIEPANIDNFTMLYLPFDQNLNNTINNMAPETAPTNYKFVASACKNGIVMYEDEKIYHSFDTDFNVGRISALYRFNDVYDKDLWSLIGERQINLLSCSIKEGKICVYYLTNEILSCDISDTTFKYNQFVQIGTVWSLETGYLYLVVNGNVVATKDISEVMIEASVKGINIGYNDNTLYYCKDVIIDDFEYSHKLNVTFINLPQDFIDNNASISIDTQKGRRNYTNSSRTSILTKEISTTSDENGNINISIKTPTGSIFTETSPKVYHNNESTLLNVNWNGLGTDTISCVIHNMGSNVVYNLIIIYEVAFDVNQGCSSKPEQMFKLIAEKNKEEFLCVRQDKIYEEYSFDRLSSYYKVNINLPTNKLYAYNINLNNKLGCGCLIKYYVSGVTGNRLILNKNLFMDNLTHIYDVNVFDQIDKSHIMTNCDSNDEQFIIDLSENISENDILEIFIGISKSTAVYDNVAGGIDNLHSVKNIQFNGDGVNLKFTKYLNTRIVGAMSAYINNESQYVAYVNGKLTPVNITFKDCFIDIEFLTPPINKTDISIFVNVEYQPLESERLQVWYNTPQYASYKHVDQVKLLNNSDILYHDNSIFAITEGINYSTDVKVNKNNINCSNLPTINNIDNALIPTKIFGNATNIKGQINYAIYNDNDYNDSIPMLNKLKIQLSNKKINRGYTGYVTIDNKSLYSALKLEKNIPHLNIFPFLIKDQNDKVLMGIITTYDASNSIYINAEYDKSAIDIFELDVNIIIKGGKVDA